MKTNSQQQEAWGARSPEHVIDNPKPGTHMARLLAIVDLGHQPGYEYRGNIIPSSWMLQFTYELVNSHMQDGRPHVISESMKNNSWEDKGKRSNLMARVRSIDPENQSEDGKFLPALLGKPCMVTVSENAKGYSEVRGQAAVSGVPFGMEVPELTNDKYMFVFSNNEVTEEKRYPDMELWPNLGRLTRKKIMEAINYPETGLAVLVQDGGYDTDEATGKEVEY